MDKVTVNITGLKELQAFLSGMPDKFNYKFLTGTHKTALKPFIAEAKRRAPELGDSLSTSGRIFVVSKKYASRSHMKGNLRDSIGMGLSPRNKKMAGVWAGPRSRSQFKKGLSGPDAWYAHMIEFGHLAPKKGGGTQMIPPNPFIRSAWDATFPHLSLNIQFLYKKRISDYARKMSKKGASFIDTQGNQRIMVEKDD